jgi:tetratricopeptide (TPR) repeat protein
MHAVYGGANMPKRLWITVLSVWPGLAQVWSGQEVLGLILAAAFALALNAALVARFIWTEAVPAPWPGFFSVAAVLCWGAAFGYTLWWAWLCHPERYRLEIDRLFRESQEMYLQGRWNEARKRLERILSMDETDADALMQLGMLFVRTEQTALARKSFRQCLELEAGVKWRWEIDRTLAKLES